MSAPLPGLDIDRGNTCSRIAYGHARRTFALRAGTFGEVVPGLDGSFSNVVRFGDVRIGISSDGIGTKIEVAERVGRFDTLGFDLVAMVVDDLVSNGLRPTTLSNILDVDHLDERVVDELMRGLYEAAAQARIVVSGGEIAELGSRVSGWGNRMHFNWCATGIGYLPPGCSPIDGSGIQVGDAVISLRSRGFRSNGFSKIRMVMEGAFGPSWHTCWYDESHTWGEVLLTPSRIYAPAVVGLLDTGVPLAGIAHVTGGGIGDNLARVLRPNRVGARLDSLFPPWPFMLRLQDLGDVGEEEAHRLWNMGNGMLLVVRASHAQEACAMLKATGCEAQAAGEVTSEPVLRVQTRGRHPKILEWPV